MDGKRTNNRESGTETFARFPSRIGGYTNTKFWARESQFLNHTKSHDTLIGCYQPKKRAIAAPTQQEFCF